MGGGVDLCGGIWFRWGDLVQVGGFGSGGGGSGEGYSGGIGTQGAKIDV